MSFFKRIYLNYIVLFLLCLPVAAHADDVYEDNDSISTAASLSYSFYPNLVLEENDVDWYRLDNVLPGELEITMTTGVVKNPLYDINLELYNADGNNVAHNINNTTEEIIQYSVPLPSSYFVKVVSPNSAIGGGNTYSLDISLQESGFIVDDVFEPNNTFSAASSISLGSHSDLSLTPLDSADWYKIDIQSPGELSVVMTSGAVTSPLLDLNLELYNSNQQVIAANINATNQERITYSVPLPGSYYFKVLSPNFDAGGGNLYSLDVSFIASEWSGADSYEPNDSFSEASTIGFGSHANLTLSPNNIADWYKLENLTPGQLQVVMTTGAVTSPLLDINLELYDSNNRVVASNISSSNIETINYHVITEGVYYVKVVSPNFAAGGGNSYKLDVNRVIAHSGDEVIQDDYFDLATELSNDMRVVSGQKAFDEDWYKFVAQPGSFEILVRYDESNEELSLGAYDADGNRLSDVNGSGGLANVELDRQYKEEIYFTVIGAEGTPYTVEILHPVKWAKELNSGPVTASSPVSFDIDKDGFKEIIFGTRPHLDQDGNELAPAKLFCLEHDGTVKWEKVFPAHDIEDPVTNKMYSSSAISSRPLVTDVDGDGNFEIIVSVGSDLDFILPGTEGDVYSPGHKGGVYAIRADTAETLWFYESYDRIGGLDNKGDGLSDGVYGSPIACDLDNNGIQEIIWGGWDQRVYTVNGIDGSLFASNQGSYWPVNQHDTIWSSPTCADINNDGMLEILIGGDITENEEAFTQTGGVFHVYDRFGREIIEGFNDYIEFIPGTGQYSFFKGKYEEQTIWSTPAIADIDGDGFLEIAYGTGLYLQDPIGNYVRVWNHDGSEYLKLITNGRTFAKPAFADIDGDGNLDIIAVTVNGWVHVWSHTGQELFATQTYPSGGEGEAHPIYSSPLVVDMDTDGNVEIVYQQGVSITVVSKTGEQLTDPERWGLTNVYFRGTPSISDLDNDGSLDLVTGGTNESRDRGVIYVFSDLNGENSAVGLDPKNSEFHTPSIVPISDAQVVRQNQIRSFVSRFYVHVLGRLADTDGLADWTNRLMEGDRSGADVARGFILSNEFQAKSIDIDEYLSILYRSFFNRDSANDTEGTNYWKSRYLSGSHTKNDILDGFLGAREFQNLSNSYGISPSFSETQGLSRTLVSEFVTRLYLQVLQRRPDEAGLNSWTDQLMTGDQTGESISKGFILSREFTNRGLNDTNYVKVLYRAFFGRSADEGGLEGWVNALSTGTHDRLRVLGGFTASREFEKLANSYGIAAY